MDQLLSIFLRRFIRHGSLTITTAAGNRFNFGDGSGPPVAVRFTTKKAQRAVLFNPELRMGEAYMDGTFVVEEGSIADVLAILLRQEYIAPPKWALPWRFARYLVRRLQQFNPRSRSRRNVAHHYDLDGRLYRLFLDADQQYSCAYFEAPDQSLDDAQLAKKRHLAAKLCVEPGAAVLDIGCGWGGLALYLAEIAGARVTGITLSQEQYARRATTERSSAAERRTPISASKTIVTSPGISTASSPSACSSMSASAFTTPSFANARNFSHNDGVCLLHTIGRSSSPSVTNPWIAKYIFPGGYIPALSEVLPAVQRARLVVTDVEILQLHYAETLKAWRERFLAHREECRAAVRRSVRPYVGILSSVFGNGVPRERHGRLPDPDGEAEGRGTGDPRLYRARGSALACAIEAGFSEPLRLAGE